MKSIKISALQKKEKILHFSNIVPEQRLHIKFIEYLYIRKVTFAQIYVYQVIQLTFLTATCMYIILVICSGSK